MISREQFCMGRTEGYASAEINENIDHTLEAVNSLLEDMAADGVYPGIDQVTGNAVASGLRTPAVQARTGIQNANSPHLTGEAIDPQDHEDRRVARWCLAHTGRLLAHGLYMEHPQWTSKRNRETGTRDPWVHWQTRRPGSGLRVFRPSMRPPTAPALPEQEAAGVHVYDYSPQDGEEIS